MRIFKEGVLSLASFKQLQEQAYNYLKSLLIADKLEDGVIYSETKVAAQMNISRTPMRDALHRLEQEGYIDIIPSKGFCLKPISPEGVIQNSQIRSALEGYCAVMLAQECRTVHARETLQGMEALLAQQKELIGSIENIPGFVSLDVQFHTAIVQYSGNEELECIFHNHLHYIQRMARRSLAEPGRMAETVKEHQDICDVIRFGAVAHVYTVTIRHMQNSQRMYLEEHASQIHLSLRSNAAGCGP